MEEIQTDMTETLITLTSDIVAAHVSNNNVDVAEVPTLISNVYSALSGLGGTETEEEKPEPAVPNSVFGKERSSSVSRTERK